MPLLVDLVKILALAAIFVFVLGKLKQPSILGFLIAGAIAGPAGLEIITEPGRVDDIAQVGVMLLMLAVGLESSFDRLRPVRRLAIGGGILQVILTIVVTSLVLWLVGEKGDTAVFLGCILAMSSTTIVLRSLTASGEADAPHGQVALGMLIVQDLAVVPLMIILPTVVTPKGAVVMPAITGVAKAAAALTVALALSRLIVPAIFQKVAKTRSRELFSIAVLGLGVGTAVASEHMGLSSALGAFVAGLALGGTDYEHEARAIVAPFRDAFAGIFFVSIGMLLDPLFVARHYGSVLLLVGLVLVGNTIITIAALLLLRAPLRVAVMVGIALSQVGEFSFLIARMGFKGGIFSEYGYQMTVAVSVATMIGTPFTIRFGPPLLRFLSRVPFFAKRELQAIALPVHASEGFDRHAILVGYGPIGRDVARGLESCEVPVVALELNPATVEKARAEGKKIFYADATQGEVLEHAGIERAKAVLVTVPDPVSARAIVREARQRNPRAFICVRTKFGSQASELVALGADEVVVEELEAGLEVLARALRRFDVPRLKVEEQLSFARGAAQARGTREIQLKPKSLGEISRVLKRVSVEIIDVDPGSPLDGNTIDDAVGELGATVLAVLRGSETITNPARAYQLRGGDRIVVFGNPQQVRLVEEIACAMEGTEPAETLQKDPP